MRRPFRRRGIHDRNRASFPLLLTSHEQVRATSPRDLQQSEWTDLNHCFHPRDPLLRQSVATLIQSLLPLDLPQLARVRRGDTLAHRRRELEGRLARFGELERAREDKDSLAELEDLDGEDLVGPSAAERGDEEDERGVG
jgi:hypothetical protein